MSSSPPSSPARPIADFFAAYPTFTYNPKESCTTEYRRLCRFMRWRRDSPESGQAWQDFRKAIVLQFNANFGTDAESVKAWWALCQTLGIKPVPRGLKEAQEAVCNTHVNLVDLTEAYGNPTCSFTVFDTAQELTEYTVKEHKYMPRDVPEAGEVLRTLLKYESKRKRLGGGGGSAMDVRESEGRKPKPVKGKGKKEEGKGTPNLNMSMAPRNTREVDPKPVKTRRKNESRPNLNVGPSRKGELSTAELFREVDEEVDEYEL
ncbi:hypothetical protein DFP72DRAFT_1165857 [Ephemerocybe angulata]|uniref:Uncharacterized protein n=1 Tax=Ephemerocybe angulata TaxID=980116 RepID=A0A8H6IBA6_9AGAR|nr:hypothetical protein DFP72DRAFT_1165857 [Tulosesus angulatus]